MWTRWNLALVAVILTMGACEDVPGITGEEPFFTAGELDPVVLTPGISSVPPADIRLGPFAPSQFTDPMMLLGVLARVQTR